MDFGRAPVRIFIGQAPDQNANLSGDLRAASAGTGAPTPVEAESGAMPTDDGFGLDDDEGFGPTGPTATEGIPEDPIQPLQFGPWMVAFEHRELLPQGQDLKGGITPTSNEHAERGKAGEDRFDEHEPILLTRCNADGLGWDISAQVPDFRTRSSFGYEQGA
jgi:hypothetical protein